jgi:hypothetical protein
MGEGLFLGRLYLEGIVERSREMIEKAVLCPERVRTIAGSFSFLEHRFLRDGFWQSLEHHALLLYLFLVLVGDRKGLSYYSYDKICSLVKVSADDYVLARNELIEKDLIAFDGRLFQVLSLPKTPLGQGQDPHKDKGQRKQGGPVSLAQIIRGAL